MTLNSLSLISFLPAICLYDTWKKASIRQNKWVKTDASNIKSYLQNSNESEIMLNSLCPPWVATDPHYFPIKNESLHELFDTSFIISKFFMALKSRGNRSSPGMGGTNYKVLHNIPVDELLILLDIFNEMYEKDSYPIGWKNTFIHFAQKPSGDGLRPLALTSCCSNLFELILYNRLRWFIESKKILKKSQTGFRKGMSCADKLSVLTLESIKLSKTKVRFFQLFLMFPVHLIMS